VLRADVEPVLQFLTDKVGLGVRRVNLHMGYGGLKHFPLHHDGSSLNVVSKKTEEKKPPACGSC
jgi:hypothetical protein